MIRARSIGSNLHFLDEYIHDLWVTIGKVTFMLLDAIKFQRTTKGFGNRECQAASFKKCFQIPSPIEFLSTNSNSFSSKTDFSCLIDVGNLFKERIHKSYWSSPYLYYSRRKKRGIISRDGISNHVCLYLRNWEKLQSCFFQKRENKG